MSAAEWLRSVTRRGDTDDLASEAAVALAALAAQAPSLVVACRRMLAHHPAHGPLWWLCARVLAAPDPRSGAAEAGALLDADPTSTRLARGLPLLDDDRPLAVAGWSRTVDLALAERFDLPAVALRVSGARTGAALRARTTERPVPLVDAHAIAPRQVGIVLVPVAAAGPESVLVPRGVVEVLDVLGAPPTWAVAETGRVLPPRLLEAVAAAAGVDDPARPDRTLARLPPSGFERIVTPRGVLPPPDALARADCPVPPELLRTLDP